MEGNCPQCRVRLDLPVSGAYECERCHTRFEVAVGAPRPRPAAPSPANLPYYGVPQPYGPASNPAGFPGPGGEAVPAAPDLGAPCSIHPGNPAAGICERCGDFMCRLCVTPVEGRSYCPRCFDLLYNRGSLQFAQRQFTLPATTLALGITALGLHLACGIFFGVPGMLTGVGGILAGMSALKQYRERPDLPNRPMTHVGLGLSALAVVLGLVILVVMIVMVARR